MPAVRPLQQPGTSIAEKVETIATRVYGARAVNWTREGLRDRAEAERLGFGALPVCMAKTQSSLSDDPKVLGRPRDFDVTVRGVVVSAGAGFVVALLGDLLRMPGLPASPQAERMDWVDGKVVGLMGA